MYSGRYSCLVLIKLVFFRRILERYSNTKFLKSPSIWSRGFPCGQSDRRKDKHDEADSRFSEIYNS